MEIFNYFLFHSQFSVRFIYIKNSILDYINYFIMKLFVLFALLCVLSIQFTIPNIKHLAEGFQTLIKQNFGQPKTVPYVNVTRYAGKWYEQAVIPFYFQRYCTKTTATYSMNPDGKSIRVDNSCVRHGQLVESVGKAIPEDSTNAKLKVQFVQTLDIGGQYWIVRLDESYSYAVISSPNYNYLWILSRVPKMSDDLYNSIYADQERRFSSRKTHKNRTMIQILVFSCNYRIKLNYQLIAKLFIRRIFSILGQKMKSFDFPNIFKYVVGYLEININKSDDDQLRQRKTQKNKTQSSSDSFSIVNCKNKLGIISKGMNLNNMGMNATSDSKRFKLKDKNESEDGKSMNNTSRYVRTQKTKTNGLSIATFKSFKDSIKQQAFDQNIPLQQNDMDKQNNNSEFSKNKITIRKIGTKRNILTTEKSNSGSSRQHQKRTSIIKRIPVRFMTQMLDNGKSQNIKSKKNTMNAPQTPQTKKGKKIKFQFDTSNKGTSDIVQPEIKTIFGASQTIRSSRNATKKTLKSNKKTEVIAQVQKMQNQASINQINLSKSYMKFSKSNMSTRSMKRKKIQNYTSLQFILDPQQIVQKQALLKNKEWKSQPIIQIQAQKQKSSQLNRTTTFKKTIKTQGSASNFKKVKFTGNNCEIKKQKGKGMAKRIIKQQKNTNDFDICSQIYGSQFYISSKKQLKTSNKKITNYQNSIGNVFLELNNFQKFMELQMTDQLDSPDNHNFNQLKIFSECKNKQEDFQNNELFAKRQFFEDKMLQMSKKITRKANQLKQLQMRCQANVQY